MPCTTVTRLGMHGGPTGRAAGQQGGPTAAPTLAPTGRGMGAHGHTEPAKGLLPPATGSLPVPDPAGSPWPPPRPAGPASPAVLCFPHPQAQHRQDPPPPQPPGAALALPANQLLSGPRCGCYSYGPALAPGRATASPRGHRMGTAVTRSDPLQTTPLQTRTYRN